MLTAAFNASSKREIPADCSNQLQVIFAERRREGSAKQRETQGRWLIRAAFMLQNYLPSIIFLKREFCLAGRSGPCLSPDAKLHFDDTFHSPNEKD